MRKRNEPVQSVLPVGVELLFFYPCPKCGAKIPFVAPTQPSMTHCGECGHIFSLVPVDAHTVQYVKLILAGGKAAADPKYL